ncbi:MAG: hypothetical protein ACI9YT_002483 [Halobacteriales archaeon]|jgi:hypothetical protein
MTTIDGRWILLAALLGALALLVPAVTAGGIGTISDAPVLANESNGSTSHWADAHHAAHHDGDDWEDHDQYHPHNATDGSYHGEYGPHHAWNGTDHDEYGSHHNWNATGDDTERGTATSGGSGWGHGNGHGC